MGKDHASLYDEVTARAIAQLEKGRLPWAQPWESGAVETGLPRNGATDRCYSGINILILWAVQFEKGYGAQRWLTYRQAQALGGHVRRGEQGATICYADRFTPTGEQEKARAEGRAERPVAFLKRFTVFNVEQCEGLSAEVAPPTAPIAMDELIPRVRRLIAATAARFYVGGRSAFYAPGPDVIHVPPPSAFPDRINWYRTAFHELGHWTGHASRLARFEDFDDGQAYAREELCAEMASAFLCAELGIVPTVRHADSYGDISVKRSASRLLSLLGDGVLRGELGSFSLSRAAQDKLIYGRRGPNPDPSCASRPSSEAVGPFYNSGRLLEPNRRTVTHRPRNPQRCPFQDIDAEFLKSTRSRRPEPGAIRNQPAFDEAPQRDQQFAGECDDPDLSSSRAKARSLLIPLSQFALRLIAKPEPCKFDTQVTYPDVACLGDTLFALPRSTCIGCGSKACERGELASVAELSVKGFAGENGCRLRANAMQAMQPLRDDNHLIVRLSDKRLVPDLFYSLQLLADHIEPLNFSNKLNHQTRRQSTSVTRSQGIETLWFVTSHRIEIVNALGRQQPLDTVDVLVLLAPKPGSFPVEPLGIFLLDARHAHQTASILPTAMSSFDRSKDGDDIEIIGLAVFCAPFDLEACGIDDPAANAFLRQRAVNPEPIIANFETDKYLASDWSIFFHEAHQFAQIAAGNSVTRNLRFPFYAECCDPRTTAQFERDKQVRSGLGGHGESPLQRCGQEAILPPREYQPHGIYIGAWLSILREDNRAVFRAASLASKAAGYILAFQEGMGEEAHP